MTERPWTGRDIVLDTNVLIHLSRPSRTGQWLNTTYGFSRRDAAPVVSVVSVAEARQFAEYNAWSVEKRERLRIAIGRCIVRDVTLDDHSLLQSYETLDCESRRLGRRMGKNDLWIAAETRRLGAVLLTSDGDFDHLSRAGLLDVDRYQQIVGGEQGPP